MHMYIHKHTHIVNSLVKSFSPFGLWILYTLLGPRQINFKMFCWETLMEGALRKG